MTTPAHDLRDDAPRYVAEALKITGREWVEVSDLVANYDPPRPNNLNSAELRAEVRHDNGWPTNEPVDAYTAKDWLIRDALERIGGDGIEWKDIEWEDDRCRLAEGVDVDTLVLDGEPLIRGRVLPDLFDPETGEFADNIRTPNPEGYDELRWSMETFGYLPGHPIVKDENGMIIEGHRRAKVAEELGIAPEVITRSFGSGDAGTAKRVQQGIGSNVGFEPMSAADRKRIAAQLYGKAWRMDKIAEVLRVSTMTVSRDLRGLTGVKPSERGGRPRKQTEPITIVRDPVPVDPDAAEVAQPLPREDQARIHEGIRGNREQIAALPKVRLIASAKLIAADMKRMADSLEGLFADGAYQGDVLEEVDQILEPGWARLCEVWGTDE
jgi:hypothetical protein